MPIIKSAKKALRQTRKRTVFNKIRKISLAKAIKNAGKEKKSKDISKLYSLLDKAAKGKIIHKNKARRIKSRLAKLFS